MPSNIEKLGLGFYRTSCACSDDKHNLTYDVSVRKENDPDWKQDDFTLYVKGTTGDWQANVDFEDKLYFIKILWWRIKTAIKLLYQGEIESEYVVCFRNREHIEEFAQSILDELRK